LPSSVARRKQACLEAPSSERRVFVTRTVAETLREQIAPAGLFGRIGLDDPKSRQRREFSPFERIVPNLQGSTRFADIVSWNIEHLHARSKWDRMPKIAELIRNFRCDFWGLQEVDDASLQELVKVVNSGGRLRYAHFSRPERGQQCGALYRTDTTRVSVIKPSANIEKAFGSTMQVSLRKGEKATRKVFERPPLLLDVRVVQASSQVFDFRCAIVHLKSTDTKIKDTGSGLRAKAGQILAQWIAEDRESGIETDYLIFGDMNAETAQQGLRAFAKKNDLNLLSVGMQDKYGPDQALTRVASKRLLDHIVVTAGSVPLMPKEDISEQIIIRADADIAGWTSEMSDHVPVAVRFVLGEDKDPAPRRRR
jgi:endonuclease/exonuclease/phosphatase family metal-dependent hydrolase